MQPKQVTEHVFAVDAVALTVYLITQADGLTLVDAGFPGTMDRLGDAVRALDRRVDEIHDVLLTHCHPDHAAGLAEVKKATGARVWMHPADAAMVRAGRSFRPWKPGSGLRNWIFAQTVVKRSPLSYEPVDVDSEVAPGETIPVAGGIKAIGTPGHTLGHLAFLWAGDGGVLFTGDTALNHGRLTLASIYEDRALGLESLRSLGRLEFETACFAHGAPIVGGAAAAIRRVWA